MRQLILLVTFFSAINLACTQHTNPQLFHQLDVFIEPAQNLLKVEDEVKLVDFNASTDVVFHLNAALSIDNHSEHVKIKKLKSKEKAKDFGMDRDDAGEEDGKLSINTYKVKFLDDSNKNSFRISYSGKILSPIEQSEANYQRGFSESPGIIAEKGIYLAGSTYWVPHFEDLLMGFELTTSLPEGWRTVSQGGRNSAEVINGRHVDKWTERQAQEEVFLIGAQFHEYSFNAGNVKAMAFLRTPDEALANKYLETTAQYLEMYRQLVGPFPYAKFALVENFWETGYGMPSFTLLGERIIRFPFILHSSYPHELLHNWWGNSVYVDFETGNWCEGITAYMADHLIKEQRGQGDEYRRTTLQKFADYVTPENDFPVAEFLSRYNSASEAIGYGKVGTIFHMLRQKLGDENYIRAIQRFNRENAFKVASWEDIEASFQSVSDEDLGPFFKQWINRKGAPELELAEVDFDGQKVSFTILQKQQEDAFFMELPMFVYTTAGYEYHTVKIDTKRNDFSIDAKAPVTGIKLDPKYDVFRVLHPDEVPASLSKAYGADETVFVLPGSMDLSTQKRYTDFIEQWKSGNSGAFETVKDSELSSIPADKTVWILGYQNKLAPEMKYALQGQDFETKVGGITIQKKEISTDKNSTILTAKHPANKDEVLVFFSIEKEEAIAGLVRKLPHYGKYSFLSFVGDEPTNTVKGQWEVTNSPLVWLNSNAEPGEETAVDEKTEKFMNRRAMAYLAPVFSSDRIMEDINYLASADLKGRGIGTPELDQAANYIKNAFKKAGLQPFENDSYFQKWTHDFKVKGNMELTNVIGYIPGSDEKYKNEPVVVTAHYDHLGLGWPDVRPGNEGKIHFGADDNASGVAVMIELARNMVKTAKPVRPIYFVACTAEEAGLIGSRYFVDQLMKTNEGTKPFANLNLDTNGRLFDKKLLVLNGNTAREWKFIFMGTEYVTGVKTELVQQQLDASDQVAFNEVGVPGVQLFSGAHTDYHKPGDTVEKLDPAGMVKVATVAKEVIQYLAERTDPMPYTGVTKKEDDGKMKEESKPKSNKRAATGSMPDFAYSGVGVKIAAITTDSPADKAGMKTGDVIITFDGKAVKNLREYSNALKTKAPGDKVKMEILRGEEKLEMEIELGER
jgi:aminopeptidase N